MSEKRKPQDTLNDIGTVVKNGGAVPAALFSEEGRQALSGIGDDVKNAAKDAVDFALGGGLVGAAARQTC